MALDQRLIAYMGSQLYLVTGSLESDPESNVRLDVAARADGDECDVHGVKAFTGSTRVAAAQRGRVFSLHYHLGLAELVILVACLATPLHTCLSISRPPR